MVDILGDFKEFLDSTFLRCVPLRAVPENASNLRRAASFQLYELNVFITHRVIVYDEITREGGISTLGIRPL